MTRIVAFRWSALSLKRFGEALKRSALQRNRGFARARAHPPYPPGACAPATPPGVRSCARASAKRSSERATSGSSLAEKGRKATRERPPLATEFVYPVRSAVWNRDRTRLGPPWATRGASVVRRYHAVASVATWRTRGGHVADAAAVPQDGLTGDMRW